MAKLLLCTLCCLVALASAQRLYVSPRTLYRDPTQDTWALSTLIVPHGCDGSQTVKIHLTIPDGIYQATFADVPGNAPYNWTVTDWDVRGVSPPVTIDDREVTDTLDYVIWEGNQDTTYKVLLFNIHHHVPEEGDYYWKVVQTCYNGNYYEWINIPDDSTSGTDTREAPHITVQNQPEYAKKAAYGTAVTALLFSLFTIIFLGIYGFMAYRQRAGGFTTLQ